MHQAVGTVAGCGVNALSGLRRVEFEADKTRSVASGKALHVAGCGVNALSGLLRCGVSCRPDKTRKRRIRQSASLPDAGRKRLIRPTDGVGICRPDKTRERRIRHLAPLPDATEGAGICRPDKTRKRRIRQSPVPSPDAA
ncbi:hypothetical protein ACLB1E_02525 [Escherichia coli]